MVKNLVSIIFFFNILYGLNNNINNKSNDEKNKINKIHDKKSKKTFVQFMYENESLGAFFFFNLCFIGFLGFIKSDYNNIYFILLLTIEIIFCYFVLKKTIIVSLIVILIPIFIIIFLLIIIFLIKYFFN